jgi:hypothetical protein
LPANSSAVQYLVALKESEGLLFFDILLAGWETIRTIVGGWDKVHALVKQRSPSLLHVVLEVCIYYTREKRSKSTENNWRAGLY